MAILSRGRCTAVGAVLTIGLLAGCSGGASGSTPTWVPQADFGTANVDPNPELTAPNIPQPSLPGGGSSGSSQSASPGATPSPSGSAAQDPNVVATKLAEPTGLVVLPDGTALVGERKTGRIYRVQPTAGQPVQLVQTLAGVDGTGDGGLLDLALSPTYSQDGLIYAYLTTATDNEVVHFAIGSAPSTVIGGIPKGSTGNAGRIAFDGTGALLTGTGDAGRPALAASATSLAGKILRTNDIGQPSSDNPVPSSRVYARGLTTVDGLCVDSATGTRVVITADKIQIVKPGADLATTKAARALPGTLTGGGGCALTAGNLIVATATGQALAVGKVSTALAVSTLTPAEQKTYGRLRTVVAGSDGALWLTTRNRDGHGKPVADDDRVIRIAASDVGGAPVV